MYFPLSFAAYAFALLSWTLEKKPTQRWGGGLRSGDKKLFDTKALFERGYKNDQKMPKNIRVHPQWEANARAAIPTAQMENSIV